MNLENIYQNFENLAKDNLSFIYHGFFSDDITERLITLSEHNINNVAELSKLKKKVAYIMVECFQNIIRHGEQFEIALQAPKEEAGIFITRNIGNTYYVTSANLIENTAMETIRKKLLKINELDKVALKQLYLDILATEALSDKGGAGLGLIDMARKSGEKLEFDFERIDDKYSLFYLQVKVKNKDAGAEEAAHAEAGKVLGLGVARRLHELMSSENILMIYKGSFAQDSIMPVMKMIEDNLIRQSEEYVKRKRVFLVLIEILQNISLHSMAVDENKDAIFLMGKENGHYLIGTGNPVTQEQVDPLRKTIEALNQMDKKALKSLYLKKLVSDIPDTVKRAGLGMIDIARYSSSGIKFEFKPIDEGSSFFSMIVQV